MTGLDENCLRNLKSSEILKQDFLRCDSKENISEKQSLTQKTFLKTATANELIYVNQPLYETIDELIIQALYSEPIDNKESVYSKPVNATIDEPTYVTMDKLIIQALYSEPIDNKESVYSEPVNAIMDKLIIQALYSEPVNTTVDETICTQKSNVSSHQQKIESVSEKSLLTIEGNFKKRDAKNLQKIKDTTRILNIYSPGQVNFDVRFNLILSDLKKIKSSSGKLAAFLYVLDSTKDLNQSNSKKLYKQLPRKYKKLIKKSNPKFSLDMHSTESLKSIRAHLEKRSIFIKAEPFPLKDRI